MVIFNHELASELGLDSDNVEIEELALLFSGNKLPAETKPFAQAYAGHQFGHFTMLGDGRAVLLGEHLAPDGKLLDIQFKGSGQTPYSRRGDGKANLYSMLREYIISEAMHFLNIPTSRSLAVVTTGEKVQREFVHDGAVLTRVASSHIRVGTFEYVARFVPEALKQFFDYTLSRHYPELQAENEMEKPILFFQKVMEEKIRLVVNWLRVGFIHGVMNTDNTTISGETIDYGPCAFLNNYNPAQVFSSIDHQGRYAFGNQPSIAYWNLGCLASALLPLVDENQNIAIEKATQALERFEPIFKDEWQKMMNGKFGFENQQDGDSKLIDKFIVWMKVNKADYTNSFLALEMDEKWCSHFEEFKTESFKEIKSEWIERVKRNPGGLDAAKNLMQASNPSFIPRNHIVEHALLQASEKKNMKPSLELLEIWKNPYTRTTIPNYFQFPPSDGDDGYQTFCGT
jgi:uncharacterized protein YdiU (UPF0061 family)